MLVITTPADDHALAPIEAMRAAAGVADDSRDDELEALSLRISAEIVDACDVAVGEGAEPTLRKERLTETFSGHHDDALILSRRHNVEIVSVTEDGVTATLDARSLESEKGLLYRWIDGRKSFWNAREIVIVYDAGFDTVPPGLVGVVTDMARIRLSEASADPLVKAVTVDVEGIDSVRTDRWVGGLPSGKSNGGLPPDIMARLARFMNYQVC
jgi:hypothetical protein